jgi:streptomycin 6-kinase
MKHKIDIPEAVRRKALAAGETGTHWLAELDATVNDVVVAWGIELGQTLGGGTEAFVAEATTSDGRAAVLKVLPPGAVTEVGELQTLLRARGRGYAAVYAADMARGALLLERLGPSLATHGLSVDAQIAILCETLIAAWAVPPNEARFITGAEKADNLSSFIATTWRELGQPCSARLIDTALHYAEVRRHSFDPRTAVLAHGDAHPWNALRVPGAGPERFKFIDPDGLFIERAYDLAIPMREWSAELLAGDPRVLGMQRCRRLAALTGVDPEAIWQWGFIERLSTGLLCLKVGLEGGSAMLAVAEAWV